MQHCMCDSFIFLHLYTATEIAAEMRKKVLRLYEEHLSPDGMVRLSVHVYVCVRVCVCVCV